VTFAPPLTWMHLFPAGTSYDCEPGPAWFRDALRPSPTAAGGGRVRIVLTKRPADALARAGNDDGLVAINCPGLSAAQLREAGFTYLRRFAAVPNVAEARWFIPIDAGGAVASGAFDLYTPTRTSARIKRAAAQLAARAGVPGWYRDEVWVAQRREPPLEVLLRDVLGVPDLRLALSAGAPEPARNRKASAALLGTDGRMLGFAKIAGSPLSRRLLEHEGNVLAALAEARPDGRLAPRRLFAGEADGRYVLVQSPLPGRPAAKKLTPAHLRFLEALQLGPARPAAESGFVRSLAARLAALRPADADLSEAFAALSRRLTGMSVPATVIHGDFTPWNLRRDGDMVTAFDWEYATLDGLPVLDETHHELQVGYLIDKWSVDRAAAALDRRAANHPQFAATDVVALQAVYLLDAAVRLAEEGYATDDPMLRWHRALLARRAEGVTRS